MEATLINTRSWSSRSGLNAPIERSLFWVSPLSKQRSCASQSLKLLLAVRSPSSFRTDRTWIRSELVDISATKVEEPSVTEVSTKRRVQETRRRSVKLAKCSSLRCCESCKSVWCCCQTATLLPSRDFGAISSACTSDRVS